MAPLLLLLPSMILFILIQMPTYILGSYDHYPNCSNPYSCGNLRNIGFPFWGDDRPEGCGQPLLHLECKNNITYITIKDVMYEVLEANPDSHTLRIAREDYFQGLCPLKYLNTSLDPDLFVYGSGYKNLTLYYGCFGPTAFLSPTIGPLPCFPNGTSNDGFVYAQFGALGPPLFCNASVIVPVPSPLSLPNIEDFTKMQRAIIEGFEVRWMAGVDECVDCMKSSGVCGYDLKSNQQTCYCRFQPPSDSGVKNCSFSPNAKPPPLPPDSPLASGSSSKWKWQRKTAIGASAASGGVVILLIAILGYRKRHLSLLQRRVLKETTAFPDHNVDDFLKSYGSLAPRRYSYSEVKRITNSFTEKLGQGGYGVVYKASLPDGCPMAVKVISESKGSGEEFINEVASISRTSHVNIVSLLGFCYERNKRALIYEFMPNGSLDKFIYNRGSSNAICNLEWNKLYQIAIGVARGLEYLHRGCSTRILHLDIKPQNILLDEDLCPKISDFGLAKLCQKKESIVSLLGTRGTIGFIAPEVFSRTFDGVSHKSDVYSYGMLIIEMVGGRKNHESGGSHTIEMYFPDWIYKDLEQGNTSASTLVITEEENVMVRKMTLVSLWCIQTYPSDRPSISKVVEMLEGPLQSVPFPPKPVLHPPAMPPLQITDISSSNMLETNSITTEKDGSIESNELSKDTKVNAM